MKMPKAAFLAAFLIAFSGVSWAIEYESDEGTEAHVPTVAYEVLVLPPGETIDPAIIRADLDYTAAMKRHHEGAVTMSTDYLDDPRGTNPILRKLARAIIGADPRDGGKIFVKGVEVRMRHPAEASRRGVGFMPEDRKTQGLVPGLSVVDNITLPSLGRLSRAGVVSPSRQAGSGVMTTSSKCARLATTSRCGERRSC